MSRFTDYFALYDPVAAPFMHQMLAQYDKTKPLQGITIVHNVPLTLTTLLKIACLDAAGADVTVTNPSFMHKAPKTIEVLQQEGLRYQPLADIGGSFDLLLDCGAELIEQCHASQGIVELTRTGAMRYEAYQDAHVPIVSVDNTRLKSLETCLGTGEGVYRAIMKLAKKQLHNKKLLIFGFGKVGTGIAYYFSKITQDITVVDMLPERLQRIEKRGYQAVSAELPQQVEAAIKQADIIVTATGIKDLISNSYAPAWFKGKILANAGAEDEFGFNFKESEVLAAKKPVNFALKEPTLMRFLDPIFYAHNLAIEDVLNDTTAGFRPLNQETDKSIVEQWAKHHGWSLDELDRIF
ncbi:NAD(P)-dependent oxidoreductase [Kangiella shandongensis]|uniref:NAD(P)-dependent oxidoreductase n=1 Tax=Kangiella shandongensis TaxID=2763258 RepID=UPI001CBE8903|nr:NAD(P)-dependent oxidoreductase [Kangiella shandongensis]